MTIEEMKLDPEVEGKARQLLAAAPRVRFTSGRRQIADQARAMAQNVAQKRDWIRKTYLPSEPARRCQAWVDAHPEAQTITAIAFGLLAVLRAFPESELLHLSRHFSGRAFDVQPRSCTLAQIHALSPRKFITSEGGLERWHVDF